MKILHLPTNIASMPAITVNALNQAGHQAKGLILQGSHQQSSSGLTVFSYNKRSWRKYLAYIQWYLLFVTRVVWADVIHWCGSFDSALLKFTLPLIKFLKKPALVEFVGSDIRNPEVEFEDNPYYKRVFHEGYEYAYESAENSHLNQSKFAKAGFGILIMPGMGQYVEKNLFKKEYVSFQRIDVAAIVPHYPDPANRRTVIVHTPTAPKAKGTSYITAAIETLKTKYDLDFILIQNMSHQKALEAISNADIFCDQIILGSYGMALMEAMAYGKPVICFMKDSVLKDFPQELPAVNANPDTIAEKLEWLITNPQLRNEIGKKSRAYAEKYHDTRPVVDKLITIYEDMMSNRSKN